MKKYFKILFCRLSKITFLPLNLKALAIVLMSVVIAVAPALPITAAPKGSANDVSYFRFYMKKRQWLADARTIVAGIFYLCESPATEATVPLNLAQAAPWLK
jgi:hypothetical protein